MQEIFFPFEEKKSSDPKSRGKKKKKTLWWCLHCYQSGNSHSYHLHTYCLTVAQDKTQKILSNTNSQLPFWTVCLFTEWTWRGYSCVLLNLTYGKRYSHVKKKNTAINGKKNSTQKSSCHSGGNLKLKSSYFRCLSVHVDFQNCL